MKRHEWQGWRVLRVSERYGASRPFPEPSLLAVPVALDREGSPKAAMNYYNEINPFAGFSGTRVGLLRGAGNAIVPPLAAEFVQAFMEIDAL